MLIMNEVDHIQTKIPSGNRTETVTVLRTNATAEGSRSPLSTNGVAAVAARNISAVAQKIMRTSAPTLGLALRKLFALAWSASRENEFQQ